MPVVMGVRTGTTQLMAMADGYRTSSEARTRAAARSSAPGSEGPISTIR